MRTFLVCTLALAACHRTAAPVAAPRPTPVAPSKPSPSPPAHAEETSPAPVRAELEGAFHPAMPPVGLPADRTLTRVVTATPPAGACPQSIALSVEHVAGPGEPVVVDTDDPTVCADATAGTRTFDADIEVHATWEPPGCYVGDVTSWCHRGRVRYVGRIVRITPRASP
jgi:hypothetical protein